MFHIIAILRRRWHRVTGAAVAVPLEKKNVLWS